MPSDVSAKKAARRSRNREFCDFSCIFPWNFVIFRYFAKEKVLIMRLMRRKIDDFLKEWKENEDRFPLIVKGARQIGKTASIMQFANDNYKNVVAINFVLRH